MSSSVRPNEQYTKDYFDPELREQGHTVWYMNALNEGHGYRKRENRDIYQQAAVLFLKQHLVDD